MYLSTRLNVFLYFFVYSCLGWLMEVILCSLAKRKLEKRGFLKGPYCPIYGFGALMILITTYQYQFNFVYVFILSMLLTSSLEFFSGWLLLKFFNQRWWDYRNRKFNIQGHICLRNALFFGIMGTFIVYIAHPFLTGFLRYLHYIPKALLVSVMLIVLMVDLINAIRNKEEEIKDQLKKVQS